ncbi:RIP metalloprotease RseP [Cohnella sp. REN36]|uniref:RIP metalloprotease RseP n=1 Tax=Cohnella sp. REN36 TaxID=2887347 RepID=UPI001D1368F9|nr:RIP metalloprotease RseP [Cohnella sp. REN36]MCC3376198.1 RIP metalloprotease RseP [Cohnella sp. REN36]
MQMVQVVFLTVLVFFVLVSIHEFGHFYFARRAGVLVREFAIGFGPKLFSIKRGETRYTLRLLPVGGFVRMAGEDPEVVEVQPGQTVGVRVKDGEVVRIYLDRLDERTNILRGEVKSIDLERDLHLTLDVDGDIQRYPVHRQALLLSKGRDTQIAPIDRQFGSATAGKKAMAIFAGPMMNFILAFVLFAVYIQLAGVTVEPVTKTFVNKVNAGSPAEQGGLHKGDLIVSINGDPIAGDSAKLVQKIEASAGKPMEWIVERGGKQVPLTITPDDKTGKAGFYPTPEMRRAGAGETLKFAGNAMVDSTKTIMEGFRKLIFGEFKIDDLGGPVRTAQVTGEIAQQGITQLTMWGAILSLYLGIFNLLPIPALDGSRLIFIGIEAIRGKPVDPNRESLVHFIGFAMLMLLMVVVTYNDILRLVKG